MIARNQSGFAPAGVIEHQLGTLAVGARFVLYGRTREADVAGTLRRKGECGCTVELAPRRVSITVTDPETGEPQDAATFERRRMETWAWSTAVGVDQPMCPNSDNLEYADVP